MVYERHVAPHRGQGICMPLGWLMALTLTSCGTQDPAFRETGSDAPGGLLGPKARSADGSVSPVSRGEGAIGVDALVAARQIADEASSSEGGKSSEQESTPEIGVGKGPFLPGLPPAQGGIGTRDNVAKDVPRGSMNSVFGDESGLPLNWRTVQLTQGGAGKVDILWVVDVSASMAPEQDYLATNFNSFIGMLRTAGQDFQTAITTTDICQDQIPSDLSQRVCPVEYGGSSATHLRGSFVGDLGRKVLRRSDGDLISRFNTYTRQGTNGSGFEHGLQAAAMAVDKSLRGENETLVRPDAFLAVIVVSDEEDDGIGLGMTDAYHGHNFVAKGLTTHRFTEDNLIAYLQGVKGQGNFSVSAITSTRLPNGSLCTSPHAQPLEEGTQYIAAATKTGGIVQSICDTNWSQSLGLIGGDLSAQLSQVVLPSNPDPATIRVNVDGIEVKSWSFVVASNAVKFNAGSLPPKGAKITVGYVER